MQYNLQTAEEFCSAIQENIKCMFSLILNQSGTKVDWKWHGSIGADNVNVHIDEDLAESSSGQHTLERFRNALNALGYDFTIASDPVYRNKCVLLIFVCEKIMQDASDANYADWSVWEEKQLQKSGRIY